MHNNGENGCFPRYCEAICLIIFLLERERGGGRGGTPHAPDKCRMPEIEREPARAGSLILCAVRFVGYSYGSLFYA